jgi:hypothetical protein
VTDQTPGDDRTREMALPGRVSPDTADQTRQDEPTEAAATAPQQLPSQPEQASQGQPGQPPPGPAKATAPQVVPPEPPAPQPAPHQPAQPPQPFQGQQPMQPAQVPQPMQMTASLPQPVQAPSVPPQQPTPGLPGQPRRVTFHRFHYPIGIFLVAYGVSTLLLSVLGWSAHRKEIAGYFGEDVASPALIAVKAVQGLLVLLTLVGLVRRRDVWFLPALFGWALGFAVFCVLDGAEGKMFDLVEHGAYLVVFAFLLCLSYALGVKARVAARQTVPEDSGQDGQNQGSGQLTRTQEIALAALNRWQRQQPVPQPGPPQPGPQQQPQAPPQPGPPQPGPPQPGPPQPGPPQPGPPQPGPPQQPQAPQQFGPPPQSYGAAPQGPAQFYSDPLPPGQQ